MRSPGIGLYRYSWATIQSSNRRGRGEDVCTDLTGKRSGADIRGRLAIEEGIS